MIKNIIKNLLFIFVGSFCSAIVINNLYIPHKILTGGITGFVMFLTYFFDINFPLVVLLANIPFFILGYIFINKKFCIYSLIGNFIFSYALNLTSNWNLLNTNDIITAVLLGGVIHGIGMGLVYRQNITLGGIDMLSRILNKFFSIRVATMSFVFNIIIISLSSLYFGLDLAIYTLVCMFIFARASNFVVDGLSSKRSVMIISKKHEQISKSIIDELSRGVTMVSGKGAFTHKERIMLFCTISASQVSKMKMLIKEIDPDAFVTISETSQVFGKGNGFLDMKMIDI
jgi:uncharacterized membrane-anchored protein YitT (DUF2179 family)